MKGRQTRWLRKLFSNKKAYLFYLLTMIKLCRRTLEVGSVVRVVLVLQPHVPFLGRWLTGCPVWVWTDARSLTAVTVWLTAIKGHSISFFYSSPSLSVSFPNITVSPLGYCSIPTLDWILNYMPGTYNTATRRYYYYLRFLDEERGVWKCKTTSLVTQLGWWVVKPTLELRSVWPGSPSQKHSICSFILSLWMDSQVTLWAAARWNQILSSQSAEWNISALSYFPLPGSVTLTMDATPRICGI